MEFIELSGLRWLGLVGALVALAIVVRLLRKSSPNGFVVVSLLATGALLMLVSLFPQVVGVASDLLDLGGFKGSRLIALLLVAASVLWVWAMATSARVDKLKDELDRIIRFVSVERLRSEVLAQRHIPAGGILCVLPAFNEADNIGGVLDRMPNDLFGLAVHSVVVDDGSTDGTREVATRHGAFVLSSAFRRGQGAAIRAGFDAAALIGAEIVVNIDADGQNDPAEMAALVEPIVNGEADLVIGSRILGHHEKTNHLRHVGVLFFSCVFNLLMGSRITDVSSGYRALSVNKLKQLRLRQDQYHASEFLVLSVKQGLRITERPITFSRRTSGASKKGNELLYGARFARALFTAWLRTG